MACLDDPIRLYLFWNCAIRHDDHGNPYFDGRSQKTWIIRHRIQHTDLVDKICHFRGIDKNSVRVRFTMRYPTMIRGYSSVQYIALALDDDEDMENLWSMPSEFKSGGVCVFVEVESIATTSHGLDNVGKTPQEPPVNVPPILPMFTPNVGSFTSLLMDNQSPHENVTTNLVTSQPLIVGGSAIIHSVSSASDMDGDPTSEGLEEDEKDVDEEEEIEKETNNQEQMNVSSGHTVPRIESSFHSFPFFHDMGSGEPIIDPCSKEFINMQRWSENENELRLRMRFKNKAQAIYAVRKWHVEKRREFTVVKSKSKLWTAECKNKTMEHPCNWYIRIIWKKSHGDWEISVLNLEHHCFVQFVNNNHRNLSYKYIARHIAHLVRNDPETHVSAVRQEVRKLFQVECSYKKGWYARKEAIELLFGSWNDTFTILPKYMLALEHANPGTIVQWKHHQSSSEYQKIFQYMFWSFKPSILGFNYCRPVVCIDCTSLRGAYKGVLLVACGWDPNNHIFPLAFALVDEESTTSWDWFLRLLRCYVVPDKSLCLIFDRHKDISSVINRQTEWHNAVQRFCLRHIRANFKDTFKNKELADLIYKAGTTCKITKFHDIMEEIKRRNIDAYNYLKAIDPQKWTIAYDGGHRYGCMTTNLSELLNSVLKKCRALPHKALVEFIYEKLVQYFCQYREEASHTMYQFPSIIWRKYVKNEVKSRGLTIVQYNQEIDMFNVKSPIREDGRGNNVYIVNFRDKSCTCQKWLLFGIPCSYVFAVCRHKGLDPSRFVSNIYSKQNYKLTYEVDFYPVASEKLWSEASFTLQYYKPHMKDSQGGRS